DEISVKGEMVTEEQQPVSITGFDAEDIEKRYIQRPEELLRDVPGAEAGDYNQGGVANTFMLRGFGSGGHGGDAAVFIDGIPLNESEGHADGYADMNVIIPLEIAKAEVYKGPSSALYGNFARGGILAFETRKGSDYSLLRTEAGSFNTVNTQSAFGVSLTEELSLNTALQFYQTDGYQENSEWIRGNMATRLSYALSDAFDIAVSARAHGSEWEGPGYIPKKQFDKDDTYLNQAANAEDDGGDKRYYYGRFDLGYSLNETAKILFWAYGTQQDFTRFAKFGYDPRGQTERFYDRRALGSGASMNALTALGDMPLSVVSGVEFFREETDWNKWNTYNRTRQAKTQERLFSINTLSAFAQAGLDVSPLFQPQIGLRVDHFTGEYENSDPGTTFFTNEMEPYTAASPKAGFTSRVIDPLTLRASYSQGYQLPTGERKYDPEQTLDPVDIRQFEAGATFSLQDKYTLDIAGFLLNTDNEIHQTVPNSNIFENVGSTRRMGVEGSVEAVPVEGLEISGQLSGLTSEILENPDAALEGKEVPNVPEIIGGAGVRYTAFFGLGGGLSLHRTGAYYLNSDNSTTYDGYTTLDGDLFYRFTTVSGRGARVFVSAKNLTDEKYSQSIWEGYGTLNYAVSAPRNVSAGVQFEW
ncbi:MAG: TonB-dependent receptor, partial [Fibrobacterota bacterium]